MNTVRLRRVGAVVLAAVCFVLLSQHAQAIPVILPQPRIRTTTPLVPVTRDARSLSFRTPWPAQPVPAASNTSPIELLIKFRAGNTTQALAQAEADLSARVVATIPQLGVTVVRVASGTPSVALEVLRGLPGVAYAEPNYPVHLMETASDPDVASQWYLDAIQAPAAWDMATGEGVTIAVIDTGVDPGEHDLKDKLVAGYDFVNHDSEPWDDQGHGTHVALIAAAAANNNYGGAGVAHEAGVMPLKALNNTGSGTHAWISKAIIWAADNGADIINLSIGGPYPSQTLQDAVNYASRRGVLLIAAAGNESSNVPIYPAAYDPVLAVAGTTRDHQLAFFSNWGDYVDVAAPGTDILVAYGGRRQLADGTSLATPQVAGVAALVLSRNPSLGGDQVRDIVQTSADDLGSPGWDESYGFGQVNAYQAVSQARPDSPNGPNPTTGVVESINRARQHRELLALDIDTGLMTTAQEKAENLTSRCLSHDGVNLAGCLTQPGDTRDDREVMLVGVSSPQAVVDLLAASPAGQQLLFGPYWTIGVGYVDGGRGVLGQVWILRFGRMSSSPLVGSPLPPIPRSK